MSQNYEIEIKSLLGSKENALVLKDKLKTRYADLKVISTGKQLNHYFNNPESLDKLTDTILPYVSGVDKISFEKIIKEGSKISIRTREADGKTFFIMKASINDHTSSNGVSRIEFEIPINKKLEELDQILIESGCSYQAKWSREREEFGTGNMHICIDKNAGYGYLAEFEKVTSEISRVDEIKNELESEMQELGISELSQDRLERMFAFYNNHWQEYYGTDKFFVIE